MFHSLHFGSILELPELFSIFRNSVGSLLTVRHLSLRFVPLVGQVGQLRSVAFFRQTELCRVILNLIQLL